jgi:sulfonate transport system substrate-binding protein
MRTVPIRVRAAAAALAGITVLVGGCAAGGDRAASSGSSDLVLRVGIQNSGNSVGVESLKASKALDGAPYKVELAEFDGANTAMEALNSGAVDADIALNSSAPVLADGNAAEPWTAESAPFKIIGAVERPADSGIAIVVKADSGINGLADLKGKKISFAKGTANHYFFVSAAKRAGLDPSTVELVTIPLTEARSAYIGGAVDALVTSVSNARPLVTKNGSKILLTSQGEFVNYPFLVATKSALADPKKSEALGDLLTRLENANRWEADHLDDVAKMYETVAAQPPGDAKLSAAEGVGHYVPLDDKVFRTQQDQADVFYEQGVAKNHVDVHNEFDTRFNSLAEQG